MIFKQLLKCQVAEIFHEILNDLIIANGNYVNNF